MEDSLLRGAREHVLCPVCDCEGYTILYEPEVDIQDPMKLYGAASGVPGTQRLVRCQDCGMIYENPRFPAEVILQGYALAVESGHDTQYRMRVKSFNRALRRLSGFLPGTGARVLDIGTAGGAFLEAATEFGYEAVGLEPCHFLVEQAVKRGLNVMRGTLSDHSFKPGSFDLVCLWDVLEHLTDPKGALLEIRPLLKPGGILLINYPDIGTWQAKIAGRRFWWLLSVHLHYFTRATLKELCSRNGFTAFQFRRYWQTLELGYLQELATLYRVPLARLLYNLTPGFIHRFPLSYYASQFTALARPPS